MWSEFMYMSHIMSYVSNIIIIPFVIFFILYIHKTVNSIKNKRQEFTKTLYNYPDRANNINYEENILENRQKLVVGERKKSEENIKIRNTIFQNYEHSQSMKVRTEKYIGGGSVEEQKISSLETQNPGSPIKSPVHEKYVKHILNLKNLFLHEDVSLLKQNKAKDELKFLFTKPKIFINEGDLKKYDSYLKGDLFQALKKQGNINFKKEFWKNFVDYNFEEFKNMLVSLVNKYNEIHNTTFVQSKSIILTDPHLSKMENNTCFVISILYMIKTNSRLRSLIEVYCNDENYKQCLLKLLDKKDNEVLTEEEFNILTKTTDKANRGFKFKEQNDAVYVLESILFDKCDLIYNQFYFSGDLIVSKKGIIYHNNITIDIPRFHTSSFGNMMPIIELFIVEPDFKYDIQDLLWGQKLDDITSDDTWYSIPLFLKSPVFLGIKINFGVYDTSEIIICKKSTGEKDENGKDIMINEEKFIYNFFPYGDFVFQEEIIIRSLADGETKYTLTGFLLYELFRTPNIRSGHFIPYYKLGGKWSCTYLDVRKTGSDVLPEFPLLFKFNKSYVVSMLFYEKV